MTYCVGMLLDEGLVMASDSRTNAGVDRVATFQKMFLFQEPGEKLFVLLTAGNLSVTQSTISYLNDCIEGKIEGQSLMEVTSMYAAARTVGRALRAVWEEDGPSLKAHDIEFNASIILGGQVKGGQLRLFQIYAPGNFVEASADTPYFQIGEVKYGKPVIDRIVTQKTSLAEAAKCALISFDSTMRSNVSVGPPLDLLLARRDSLDIALQTRLEDDNPYLREISRLWGEGLKNTFEAVPDPDWTF
ncbi:MAG: peptidase [Alphaproteobacteria bacterium]|nr:peptidase [Alphaproteobacteria bacterium]